MKSVYGSMEEIGFVKDASWTEALLCTPQIKLCIGLFALLACKIPIDKEKTKSSYMTHPNNLVIRDQKELRWICSPWV